MGEVGANQETPAFRLTGQELMRLAPIWLGWIVHVSIFKGDQSGHHMKGFCTDRFERPQRLYF